MNLPVKPVNRDHLDSLALLRGMAAVIVCFCHLGGAFITGNSSRPIFIFLHEYGKFGVNMFFVISGFIIPLSLHRGKYGTGDYFTFLYKRVLRLHPPYLLAVAFTLVIMLVSYKIRHLIFPENFMSILKTCLYLHIPADNPVFWTLLVEAQYYIFIGVFYFAINYYPRIAVGILIPIIFVMSRIGVISNFITLFSYIDFFLIGCIGYLIYVKKGSLVINYAMLAAIVICSFFFYDLAAVLVSIFTISIILFYKKSMPKYLQFFGIISYSLYLIHFPIGTKLINISRHFISSRYDFLIFTAVFLLITVLSWLFCKLVEYPSERFSRQIKYKAYQEKASTVVFQTDSQ